MNRSHLRKTATELSKFLFLALMTLVFFGKPFDILLAQQALRVGHFPNLTQPQGVIGHAYTRSGLGWFEKELGSDVPVEWYIYNAGPSAFEALMAGSVDMIYVGPSPTINAYIRTKGQDVRIIAGACSGGAALLVQGDGRIQQDSDFKGKKLATPQLGNTQDVAARKWLKSKGYQITMKGGDLSVIPTTNPDQITLFKLNQLDAAWTVEPWVSRLEIDAQAKVYLFEKDLWKETGGMYVSSHLVTTAKMVERSPELLKKWIKGHVSLTKWIQENPDEAKKMINQEIHEEIKATLSEDLMTRAWSRIQVTYDPIKKSLNKNADDLYKLGFISKPADLSKIYELSILNTVLKEFQYPEITQ